MANDGRTGVTGISVVVPVFNSEHTLGDLVARLEPVLRRLADRYELILVNDGSRDGSWLAVKQLVRVNPWVRGIDLMRNYGQHNALLSGVREARFDVIVTLDDDLQHPPEEIPRLLGTLGQGFDVVYGTPDREAHGLWRGLASRITKRVLQSTMGAATAPRVSAFRAFRTALCAAFSDYRGPFVSLDVLLSWATTRFGTVAVRHDDRRVGASNYTVRTLALHAINMVTGFSTWPLRVASMAGFGFTLVGAVVLVFVIGRYLIQGDAVPGFPFLASIIAIFSGAQLFALGVIGEYLARLHYRAMERPTYVIRDRADWRRDDE